MIKANVSKFFKEASAQLSKHSPEILTGFGIAGMITTTVLAVRATPKALMLIDERKEELEVDELPVVETVKAAWKPYIPAAVTGAVSVACVIGASSISAKRTTALATAYKLSEEALTVYKKKVVETIGEKKEQKVREEVAKEYIQRDPVGSKEIFITEKGNTRFYDVMFKRRFESDTEHVKKIVNDLNRRMRDEMYISLNDFYQEVGLGTVPGGELLGWNITRGYIEPSFDAMVDDDGIPCIVLDYLVRPDYKFNELY